MSPIFDLDAVNNAPDEFGKPEGIYHCYIGEIDDNPSQSGNAMIKFALFDVQDDRRVCFDRLMFAGKPFALHITKKKLHALGIDMSKQLHASDLNHVRCWVSVVLGKPNEKGRRYLEADFNAEGSAFGYWPDSSEHPLADPSQAATLVSEPARSGRASWPAGVTREQDLPPDHPDYCAF